MAILPTVATNYVLGAYLSRYNIHPKPLPQKKGPSSSTWTRCHLSSVFQKKKKKRNPLLLCPRQTLLPSPSTTVPPQLIHRKRQVVRIADADFKGRASLHCNRFHCYYLRVSSRGSLFSNFISKIGCYFQILLSFKGLFSTV